MTKIKLSLTLASLAVLLACSPEPETAVTATPFSEISAASATTLPGNTAVIPGTVVTSPTITATSTATFTQTPLPIPTAVATARHTTTPTPMPTAINLMVTPTATVNATGNGEWLVYRNDFYGYEFSYPPAAKITKVSVEYFPAEELPPNVTPVEYLKHLQELYPEGACVAVDYKSSFITFLVPDDKGGKYIIACGVTGIGNYDVIEKFETVSINGQPVMVRGLELHEHDATATIVDEFWGVLLDDGTRISYGSGGMYEGFLEDKETILQILASFRTGLVPCTNDSQFLLDVTVPDGTHFSPNSSFTKTWRLLNNGSCNWEAAYQFQFFSGDQMNGPGSILLSKTVAPGEAVDISVVLIAPESVGTYRAYWQLATPDGILFGAKPYVEIVVP